MAALYKKWTANGHTLEIKVRMFEDEAGNQHPGLVGTMDGQVRQWTMDQFKADVKTLHYIENNLDLHAWGRWS